MSFSDLGRLSFDNKAELGRQVLAENVLVGLLGPVLALLCDSQHCVTIVTGQRIGQRHPSPMKVGGCRAVHVGQGDMTGCPSSQLGCELSAIVRQRVLGRPGLIPMDSDSVPSWC